MIKNKPPFLLLPPKHINSAKFLRNVSSVKQYKDIRFHNDVWFKAIVGNKLVLQMSERELPFFIRSIKGLRESNSEPLIEELLYLEGLSDFPKAFIDDNFTEVLERKYNFYESPFIRYNNKDYILLYDYDLKDRHALHLEYI